MLLNGRRVDLCQINFFIDRGLLTSLTLHLGLLHIFHGSLGVGYTLVWNWIYILCEAESDYLFCLHWEFKLIDDLDGNLYSQ